MRRIIPGLFGVVLVLAVAACGGGGSRNVPSNAVAVVGDRAVLKSDWDALITQTRNTLKATNQAFPKPGTVALANLRTNATQFLITASEYEQEADKLGVKVTDKLVEKRLQQFKKQSYGGQPGQKPASKAEIERRYRQALKKQGYTDQEVHQGFKLGILRDLVQKKVTAEVKISDSEVKDYYDKHKQQYQTPAQPESRNVRHILVKSKALADRLYGRLHAKPGLFPKLARQYSTDTSSASAGGALPGGAVKGRLVKPFERAAFSIKTNTISKPVHTQFGWHIIEALGPVKPPTPAKPTPLVLVKEAIRQTLLSEKRSTAVRDWQQKIVKHYCGTIAYQAGYAPPPGQDPCKARATTTTASTTG
jgi:parvulin-like peptidyl-prolyl isomerase